MTYCSSIDVGLFLETNGTVRTCCSGTPLGNMRTESVDEIFSSPKFIEIKQQLDAGQPHETYCRTCVNNEAASGTSTRDYFQKFPSDGTRQIKQIDIRWSNVCNLSCRMCSPEYSSTWAKLLDVPVETTRRDYYADVLATLEQHRDTIEQIDLLGGEPLMQRQNEQLLALLPDGIPINIVTNLSIPLENNQVYQALKHRNGVNWIISLDHIGNKLEYIRHGADWDRITHNLALLRNDFPESYPTILPAYSIWNALDLAEIYEFANDNSLSVVWQLAQGNDYSSLKAQGTNSYVTINHGPEIRRLAVKAIDSVRSDPFLQGIRESLLKSESTDNTEFLAWTERTERFMPPKRRFQDLWPGLYQLLNT